MSHLDPAQVAHQMRPISKLTTGIEGFDLISYGGVPKGRTTLVSGTSGSAKTVFATQFLADGITKFQETGVMVTFEEPPSEISRNMMGFGWNIPQWEAEGKWLYVDAAPEPGEPMIVVGDYDFGALLSRIEYAIRKVGASRVSLDSLSGIFSQFDDATLVRREVFRMIVALRSLGVTSLLTAERTEEEAIVSRHGVEEFVADNVILLRNTLEHEKRRRTIEILKYRGTTHQKGEFPFTVTSDSGVVVLPLSAMELRQRSSNVRIKSGNDELDRMCGGGFFRDSIILVTGATGTGKTLISTQFIDGGFRSDERCLLFAFEESHDQLFRNASGWGVDFERMEAQGQLRVVCIYPEAASLEDHLISIKRHVQEFRPNRVAVDSLSALERVSSLKGFREFIVGLTSFIKHQEIAGLFTATSPSLLGGESITETHISTITDSIILLRYVEIFGEMRRGLTVLKMRGSAHDKEIREFTIDGSGIHVGRAFRGVAGILSGQFTYLASDELQRLDGMFQDGARVR